MLKSIINFELNREARIYRIFVVYFSGFLHRIESTGCFILFIYFVTIYKLITKCLHKNIDPHIM